jgi:putative nucleotidyltransferase with HDIG domain
MNFDIWSIVPQGPDYEIDWDTIDVFVLPEESHNMRNCMQSPLWHREGDVWTHTQMVCDMLVGLPEWRDLNRYDKYRTFLAALLHDIGKPPLTKTEDDGDVSSKGHAKRGARLARQILRRFDIPVLDREIIVSMIRAHAAPIHAFLREGNPERVAIRASMTLNNSLLYMLCKADTMGRIPEDEGTIRETLETLDLYGELCEDKRCFNNPFPFPSNHTRFLYFRKENMLPDYEMYDDTEFEVIMLSGVPGAGKDYWLSMHGDLPDISFDNIREYMSVKPTDNQGKVAQEAQERAKEFLRKKQSFILNATNVTKFTRQKWINLFSDYKARVKIIYIEPARDRLKKQNEERGRGFVASDIIDGLFYKMDVPTLMECHSLEYVL